MSFGLAFVTRLAYQDTAHLAWFSTDGFKESFYSIVNIFLYMINAVINVTIATICSLYLKRGYTIFLSAVLAFVIAIAGQIPITTLSYVLPIANTPLMWEIAIEQQLVILLRSIVVTSIIVMIFGNIASNKFKKLEF